MLTLRKVIKAVKKIFGIPVKRCRNTKPRKSKVRKSSVVSSKRLSAKPIQVKSSGIKALRRHSHSVKPRE